MLRSVFLIAQMMLVGIEAQAAISFGTTIPEAVDVPFDNSTNGFVSEEVQSAIEEARNSAIGTLSPFVFVQSGNVKNKWLGFANNASSSEDIPFVAVQDIEIRGITFSNLQDDVDIDIEIYKNAVLLKTIEIRNKRWFYDYDIGTVTGVQGDRFSIFMKEYALGTGNTTAQHPLVTLYTKFTAETDATGGAQTGVD